MSLREKKKKEKERVKKKLKYGADLEELLNLADFHVLV
jgi:hypothetical protein